MPTDDADRLEKLLDAAGRAVQPTQPGWQTLPQRLARTPQAQRRHFWPWLWLAPAPFGIAAAVALWIALSSPKDLGTTTAQAEGLPVVVQRQDVELTVLSVAETEGETLYMPILPKVAEEPMAQPNPLMAAPPMSGPAGRRGALRPRPVPFPPKRTGQALVKDHRLILNLKKGDNTVRFTEVAASIDPTSVRFVSNTDPAGTEVVEQNFEYDLANGDALLKRYLDRKIVCIAKDGQESAGYLASFDDKAIVLASRPTPPPGQRTARSTQSLSRQNLQAVRLEEMPRDLLIKPTLVWKLRAKTLGRHDTTVSYLCGFVKWQADYVALVTPGEDRNPDLLDVTGWVSLDNTSGATYEKSRLKLIAGDVSRVRDPWAVQEHELMMEAFVPTNGAEASRGAARKQFVEKSFFEYHLYTLSAPSTVRDKQIKQLNLLQRKGVKAERRYIYDPQIDNGRLSIELVAKNEADNNLGLPLPKGRVTLEQRDRDGETGFLGHVDIDHTAVKEELKLRYGKAYDVAGQFATLQQFAPNRNGATYEMRIRNHKTDQILVRAIARIGLNWTIPKASLPFQAEDAQTVHFDFPLQPNSEQVITYTVNPQQ
jgi:hypothetical protein